MACFSHQALDVSFERRSRTSQVENWVNMAVTCPIVPSPTDWPLTVFVLLAQALGFAVRRLRHYLALCYPLL